ncbi:FRG domain-containing protein [Acidovorax sp. Leaf160]|uniref:FRG domain-containing protein n=1 Tax=Acidovorax sp. Leaf160 TaxID=1736280 RepID=UPI00138EEE3B|nr:FRG domain-containing protein [Acidovorax sp. Leaf160]
MVVSSFAEFLSELHRINYTKNSFWYRGVGDASYQLTPSLFRHKTAKNQPAYKKLELELNETFEMRSLPYAESRVWAEDDWERLFFMQHYRVPTRLLDWSGSPLVSMHFAVTSVQVDKHGNALSDAAIYVLDPNKWNNAAYAETGFPGGVLSSKDIWLKRYSPSEVYTFSGPLPPMAMRGVHNSARIVAQQGFFTVFGPQAEPMEKTFSWIKDGKPVFPLESLRKYIIPKDQVRSVREEIFSLGVSESTIYPDLEGLAAELKRTFGF